MTLVLGPLLDPGLESGDLGRRERLPALGRRHPLLGVVRGDPAVELALVELAGDDRRAARRRSGGRIATVVEPQLAFALLGVGTVALEALVGQDRPDIPSERDLLGSGRLRAGCRNRWSECHGEDHNRHAEDRSAANP